MSRSLGSLAAGWLLLVCLASGCTAMNPPSNDRLWSRDQEVLPYAEFTGNKARVYNVRNFTYHSEEDYTARWEDRTYDLDQVRSVDFILVPFADMPSGAHTMLSFGFENDEYLALSVEIRKERGEVFSPTRGLANQYELMYVLGDERDLISLRANHRRDDVYVYRTTASPEVSRALLRDVLLRANKLADQPEYYNTLTNNCTTNIRRHVNQIARPGFEVPYNYKVLLPGYADLLAYNRGLIEHKGDFAATRAAARINPLAYVHRESDDFSAAIRR